jgi:hypothetical protein
MFGFLVVKGYVETAALSRVAALKKVVFPVLVFPIRPILIKTFPA